MAARKAMEPNFEQALLRLEEIVERIQQEEIELDEALELFSEGVRLLRHAETRLAAVESRVRQLFEGHEDFHLEDFPGEL